MKKAIRVPYCKECERESELVTADEIYPHRHDLWDKLFYVCGGCGSRVGCHDGTEKPLGRLSNSEQRKWKRMAHAAFDPLWKRKLAREKCSKSKARNAGYKWLAEQMQIPVKRCHIAMMSIDECKHVINICEPYKK